MGQRPDGAREPPTGSSGNRCSWNVSCRWAVAAERGRHVLYYRPAGPSCRPVQLGGNPRPPVTTMQASAGTGPTALPGPASPASMRCVPGPGSRGAGAVLAWLHAIACKTVLSIFTLESSCQLFSPSVVPTHSSTSSECEELFSYTFYKPGVFSVVSFLLV